MRHATLAFLLAAIIGTGALTAGQAVAAPGFADLKRAAPGDQIVPEAAHSRFRIHIGYGHRYGHRLRYYLRHRYRRHRYRRYRPYRRYSYRRRYRPYYYRRHYYRPYYRYRRYRHYFYY